MWALSIWHSHTWKVNFKLLWLTFRYISGIICSPNLPEYYPLQIKSIFFHLPISYLRKPFTTILISAIAVSFWNPSIYFSIIYLYHFISLYVCIYISFYVFIYLSIYLLNYDLPLSIWYHWLKTQLRNYIYSLRLCSQLFMNFAFLEVF